MAVPALDLYDYILIARKIIRKYAGQNQKACLDGDLEGDVVRAIMVADSTFNPEQGTLEGWRYIRAVGYIRRYFERKKIAKANRPRFALTVDVGTIETRVVGRKEVDRPHARMQREEEHKDRVEFLTELLRESRLTKQQLKCVHRYYVDEKTLQEIANEFETSCQNVQQALSNSIDKIRKVL